MEPLTILFIAAITPNVCNEILVELEQAKEEQLINQQDVDDIYMRCIASCN